MSTSKVNLLCPAQHKNGTILTPGWYDREEIPEAAFTLGFVYVPPDIPVPGSMADPNATEIQHKQRGKSL